MFAQTPVSIIMEMSSEGFDRPSVQTCDLVQGSHKLNIYENYKMIANTVYIL